MKISIRTMGLESKKEYIINEGDTVHLSPYWLTYEKGELRIATINDSELIKLGDLSGYIIKDIQ